MENNILYLRKCAYLFDDTKTSCYYGTQEMIENQRNAQKELYTYYSDAEKRATPIPYTINDYGRAVITLNGKPHALNALQIARAEGALECDIINHRKQITPEMLAGLEDAWRVNVYKDSFTIYSKKFKSLYFEFFTGDDTLGYIRVHFKNNYDCFIIDARNNDIYTDGERGMHRPYSGKEIANYIGIVSGDALMAFWGVIHAITR